MFIVSILKTKSKKNENKTFYRNNNVANDRCLPEQEGCTNRA
jgi:hypothetical protein